MYHFIITTTGLFNTLRTSVFPAINNPEAATFLLGLLYKVNVHTRHISSHKYKEKRDLVHQELKLERKRIRAYPMYKTQRGRFLLDKGERTLAEEAQ